MERLYIWGKVLSNLYLKVTKTVLMNDYFCRKDTMVKLYIKTFFLKRQLDCSLKTTFYTYILVFCDKL